MKRPFFSKLQAYLHSCERWYKETPERALERAYKAALTIKAIEDEYFGGQKVSSESGNYGSSVVSYFQADLKKYLKTAKYGVAEFKASRSFMLATEQNLIKTQVNGMEKPIPSFSIESGDSTLVIIEKLNFVDEVVQKYAFKKDPNSSLSLVAVEKSNVVKVDDKNEQNGVVTTSVTSTESTEVEDGKKITGKTGLLPRSIGRTFERIQQDLDPKAEEVLVQNFRKSKRQTAIAVKFILLLILVPILTQQLTKNFLIGPIVDKIRNTHEPEIFLNLSMQEEALHELQRFKEMLEFETLIGIAPNFSKEDVEERVKLKASELEEEYRYRSTNAIKNVFADAVSLISFCTVLFIRKKDIEVFKSFVDEVIYGLSDSAKAFIIILLTDIFVGFHSPHGWEVLLENVAKHLGLPESRQFIYMFIATFPVILDTIFKYWIFRYLSRMSPSAVATYRNMNE